MRTLDDGWPLRGNKQRSVLGFAHLLKSERIIIPIDKNSSRAKSLPKI
jgi:hypothetical protein